MKEENKVKQFIMKYKIGVLFVVLFLCLGISYSLFLNNAQRLGNKYYEIALNNYNGNSFKYEEENDDNTTYYINEEVFYKITNFDQIINDYSNSFKDEIKDNLGIQIDKGEYFVPYNNSKPNGLNPLSTQVKFLGYKNNKFNYKVITTYCIDGEHDFEECIDDLKTTKETKFSLERKKGKLYINYFEIPYIEDEEDE